MQLQTATGYSFRQRYRVQLEIASEDSLRQLQRTASEDSFSVQVDHAAVYNAVFLQSSASDSYRVQVDHAAVYNAVFLQSSASDSYRVT